MRRAGAFILVSAIGFITLNSMPAQDDKPKSATDSVPSSFRSYVVVDDRFPPKMAPVKRAEDRDPRDRTHKMHCFVCEQALNPVLAIFTHAKPEEASAAAKLAKQLDPVVKDLRSSSFSAFVIFLTLEKEYPLDDLRNATGGFVREERAAEVEALGKQLATPRIPFGLAARVSQSTNDWGIGEADETVVVLYNRMKVIKRWSFPAGPPSDGEIKTILDTVKTVVGK